MILIKHRVNKVKELKNTDKNLGIEIDLRSDGKNIFLHHDPFKKGELFKHWIKNYNHKLLVLNVKEEGLEKKIIKILKKNKIKNFFFHDQSFSTLIKNMNLTNVSIRHSEFEEIKEKNFLFSKIKWVWIDNFTKFNLNKKFYIFLKKKKIKICIVSPELTNIKRVEEIYKNILYIKKNNLKIDAVCTKKILIWKKYLKLL